MLSSHAFDQLHAQLAQTGLDALGLVCATQSVTFDAYLAGLQPDLPGGLAYLAKNAQARQSLNAVLDGARSVICGLLRLPRAFEGWARFCAIGDYHAVVRQRLTELEAVLRENDVIHGTTRICVDSAPVLEREFAVRAGLGWIASNHLLVHPQFGAGIVLGELITTDDLSAFEGVLSKNTVMFEAANLVPGRHCVCHGAHACAAQCPTGALSPVGYRPSSCLAYLTTQHPGALAEPFARAMGDCVWGCDRCQRACPVAQYEFGDEMPLPYRDLTPERVLLSSAKQLTRALAGTPMAAAHPRILQRNVCYVLGNQHDVARVPLLQQVAQNNPCDWVRDAAQRSLMMCRV